MSCVDKRAPHAARVTAVGRSSARPRWPAQLEWHSGNDGDQRELYRECSGVGVSRVGG